MNLIQLFDLLNYLFSIYLVGVVFTDALPRDFALLVHKEHRSGCQPIAEKVEHPVELRDRGVEGGKQNRKFITLTAGEIRRTFQVIGADREDLNSSRVEFGLRFLELAELRFAESSPVSPIKNDQHRLFTTEVREGVLAAPNGRQCEIRCQHRDGPGCID